MHIATRNLLVTIGLVSAIASDLATATPIYSSVVRVLGGNPINDPTAPPGAYVVDVAPRVTMNSPALAQSSGAVSFSGDDINGDPATMQLHYQGQAQASAGGLKAAISLALTDPLFNAANPAYVLNSRFEVNPDGVPNTFLARATAGFSDTLAVAGAPGLSYLRAYLEIDGMTSPRTQAEIGGASVYREDRTTIWRADAFDTDHGPTIFWTDFLVTDGKVDFSLYLDTSVQLYTARMDWSGGAAQRDHSGFSDFFNTLTFNSFIAFDIDHNPVRLLSVTGSEGFAYTVANGPVDAPEPMSLVLLGLGLAALSLSNHGFHTHASRNI